MSLFPAETVLFVRTADARLLIERLQQTGLVKLAQDPALEAFVGSLRGSLRDAYAENAEGELGIDFDSLLNLPQGEVAFGMVERVEDDPAILLIADFRSEAQVAESLLEKAKEKVTQDGGVVGEQALRADTAVTLRPQNDQQNTIGVVRRDAVFVAANDPDLLASVLDRWDGVAPAPSEEPATDEEPTAPRFTESLDKNRAFASSLRECLVGREEPPQAIAFVDPIGLVRATQGRETGVRIALATLPALGVDAIEGVAAAHWVATESWDSLTRAHVLVDNPRAGVMQIVRLAGGQVAPPPYVPAKVSNYTTVNVNPQQVFDDIQSVVDRMLGEGAFGQRVDAFAEANLGVDLPGEVIPQLTGRVTMLGGFEEQGGAAPSHTLLAAEVVDEEQALKLLKNFLDFQKERGRVRGEIETRTFGDVEYYALPGPPDRGDRRRPFSPAVGVFGGAVVVSSSEELYRAMLEADAGSTARLANDLQYRLVSSRLKRLAGENPIGVWSYQNPEQVIRHWYTLLSAERTREFLQNQNGGFAVAIRNALEAGELPPVEDLVKYCTPSGTVLYDTDTGFHYISFYFRCGVDD